MRKRQKNATFDVEIKKTCELLPKLQYFGVQKRCYCEKVFAVEKVLCAKPCERKNVIKVRTASGNAKKQNECLHVRVNACKNEKGIRGERVKNTKKTFARFQR